MLAQITPQHIRLSYKDAEGFVIPLGTTSLVLAVTDTGLIANDIVDIEALENFDYPAAQIGPAQGDIVDTLEELLEGEVKAANLHAIQRRVEVGMPALEALNRI